MSGAPPPVRRCEVAVNEAYRAEACHYAGDDIHTTERVTDKPGMLMQTLNFAASVFSKNLL